MQNSYDYFSKELKIYIVDMNKELCEHMKAAFAGVDNVNVINMPINYFLSTHNVEAIVTPGNSFGIMTGGFDKAIVDYYGSFLMEDVQNGIRLQYLGEQPVASPLVVPFVKYNKSNVIVDRKYLIYIPTMRVPMRIIDPSIIYSCMRTALIECNRQFVKSVVIPIFGGCTGGVKPDVIAKYMRMAYYQLCNIPSTLSWENVVRFTDESYTKIIYGSEEENDFESAKEIDKDTDSVKEEICDNTIEKT